MSMPQTDRRAQALMRKRALAMLNRTLLPRTGEHRDQPLFGEHILQEVRLVRIDSSGVAYDEESDNLIVSRDAWAEVECEYTVGPAASNIYNQVHGAASAYLHDMVSTLPLLILGTKEHWAGIGGVSSSFTCNFLVAIPIGATLRIVSRTLKRGLSTGVTDCHIYDKSTGKLLFTGTHNKTDVSRRHKL